MSRLFAAMCNEPEHVRCALYGARDALRAEAAPHGWGLAFFQGGEVLLQRHPKPLMAELNFYAALRELRSDYLVGHVREPLNLPPSAKPEYTQPYRFRSWVFAHSGSVDRFGAVRANLLEHVPDFLRRNIRGLTDSEHLFHLFLAFLHDSGKLDDANIAVGEATDALRATWAVVDKIVGDSGGQPSLLNLVATNGRIMVGICRGRPMALRHQQGMPACEVCRGEAERGQTRSEQRPVAHEHLRSVLILSEPVSEPVSLLGGAKETWETVPDGSLIGVTRDLVSSISPLRAA